MIGKNYLKLVFYLIISLIGYFAGLYLGYKKVINYLTDKKDPKHSIDKCYTYKKTPKACID
jgi:hypothetical protein